MNTKRIVSIAALLLFAGAMQGQNLQNDWARIQRLFNAGSHDSVVVLMPSFVEQLTKRNLPANLGVAYYHYAVSLAYLGRYDAADSLFTIAIGAATSAGDPARVKDIYAKRIQLFQTLAQSAEAVSRQQAITLYSKTLEYLGDDGPLQRAQLFYQRGVNLEAIGNFRDAITDYERALEIVFTGNNETLRNQIVGRLLPLYLTAKEYAKADALSQRTGTGVIRLEYTIKLAEQAEQNGDLKKADELLLTIQPLMFSSKNDDRILEFCKKRYSFYEKGNRTVAGIDSLKSMVAALLTTKASDFSILRVQQFIALLYLQQAKITEAAALLVQIERVYRQGSKQERCLAIVEQLQADLAYLRGDVQIAITLYTKALSYDTSTASLNTLVVLNNLGLALMKNGDETGALQYFERMYRTAVQLNNLSYQVLADLNTGIILVRRDRVQESIRTFKRAKEGSERVGDVTLQVMALLRLGEAYRRAGVTESSDEIFATVRQRQARLTNPLYRIQVLQALASASSESVNPQSFADLQEAYRLSMQIGANGYLGSIASMLGDYYLAADSAKQAKKYFQDAIRYYSATSDIKTLTELQFKLAQSLLTDHQYESARLETQKALKNLVRFKADNLLTVPVESIIEPCLFSQGLALLASIEYEQGRVTREYAYMLSALKYAQRSADILESKNSIQLSAAQRESETATAVNAYRVLVDIAAELFRRTADRKYFEIAFNTSEKSRAQTFVAEVGSQLLTKLSAPRAKQIASITNNLAQNGNKSENLTLDFSRPSRDNRGFFTKKSDTSALATANQQYELMMREANSTPSVSSPTQLVTVNTLTLETIQNFLDPDEVVINYFVSPQRTYIFVVASTTFMLYTTEWRKDDLDNVVDAFRKVIYDPTKSFDKKTAQTLYDSLVAPVEKTIAGKRLIIIPSGRLNGIAFNALCKGNRYLVQDFSVTILPNASAMQFVRTKKKLSFTPSLLALGNPANPTVSALPGSEAEVRNINKIYPNAQVLIGDQATESNALKLMGSFEVIHLACHAVFNYEFPLLSALVLAPDGENDGYLYVPQLYNMDLSHTSLVVLSACETGLAKIKKNDDVIGLVRGFFYAGAPSIIASLWKVDDAATMFLMSNFHQLNRGGKTKSASLREAQLKTLQNPESSHPFFWAAFVLYGNGG
jgi:CHAT domain-containing protein